MLMLDNIKWKTYGKKVRDIREKKTKCFLSILRRIDRKQSRYQMYKISSRERVADSLLYR